MGQSGSKPHIALAIGHPARIGPELTARLLAGAELKAGAALAVLGGRRMLAPEVRIACIAADPAAHHCSRSRRLPSPGDTAFLRAIKDVFDAVLMRYRNQGQIATKLPGGFPFPISTPARDTTHAIARQGIANPDAGCAAVRLTARMAGS